ncbi:MAG: alkaline phosphatase PhoX [Bacteroidota bacterium]
MKAKLLWFVFLLPFIAHSQDTLINTSNAWKYNDKGQNLGTTWYASNFSDATWSSGSAPLGYGLTGVATTVSYGTISTNKYTTTYFRKSISISTPALSYSSLLLNVKRDDGLVVYINGIERYRSNMPSGTISNTTFSTNCASDNGSTWQSVELASSYFIDGTNVIAIEVHQCNLTSSDLFFAAQLIGTKSMASFESLSPGVQTQDFIIPSSHAYQVITQEGNAYSLGGLVPARTDFTGYVPIAGSSTNGYLMINHEVTPNGGVSNFKISFKSNTKLWSIDSSKAVNVVTADVVKLYKNCSGAVTPWGTILSGEEARDTIDANADGYLDVGWLVEIDPVTNGVCKYAGGLKQKKLWAMGRMAHENATIAKDNKTVYYGEDAVDGCLYKFVATNPTDLTAGSIYVLQLSTSLTAGAPTTSTGNWILLPNGTKALRNYIYGAAITNGATQFNGIEDVEVGPDSLVYFTSKGYGRVYRFKDNGTGVTNFETYVGGMNYSIANASSVTSTAWGLGNDNLAFDADGNLWVLQDGGNNYIWVVKKGHTQTSPKVAIFGKIPTGGEPTGITFSPDGKFLFMSIQHPTTTNTLVSTDIAGNSVVFNKSTTVVIGLKQDLGTTALRVDSQSPIFDIANPVKIFPNPSNSEASVEFLALQAGTLKMEIYNINGQLVNNPIIEEVEEGVWHGTIEAQLHPGIYFVRTSLNNTSYCIKYIKE